MIITMYGLCVAVPLMYRHAQYRSGHYHPVALFLDSRVSCPAPYQTLWVQASLASYDDAMGNCLFVSPPSVWQ